MTEPRSSVQMVKDKLHTDIHKTALIAPGLAILNYILSPDFLHLLPDKYSHLGYSIAVLIGIWFPQLMKKRNNETQTSEVEDKV